MASSDILSQTLNSITSTKLEQVAKQRGNFEEGQSQLLQQVDRQKSQLEKVKLLQNGIRSLPFMERGDIGFKSNIDQYLSQAEYDPSVSIRLQKEWEMKLRAEIDAQSLKLEYASLYGSLVEDWVESDTSKTVVAPSELGDGESFQQIGRKEMHQQRETWEEYVFKPLNTDTTAIEAYLKDLFGSEKTISKAHSRIQEATAEFERNLAEETCFDEDSLEWCINGLLNSDLLTDVKATILRDFSQSPTVLREIADVLNMRMAALDSWKWDEAGSVVEQRRHLNGRYRFYVDDDLLHTIFLRYIGVRWSVHFKDALKGFVREVYVWKPSSTPVTKVDRERRDFFLGSNGSNHRTVESAKAKLWEDDVLLEQLQSTIEEDARCYDDSGKNESRGKDSERKTGQQLVQEVLHLLVTDIIIKTRLGEDVTVIRSDFKWFGPSMPHTTMFTILKLFGVSERWISFFQRVVEKPMKFEVDGVDAVIRTRKRGTPISGPLSDVLGETVLYCLDFAINQKTEGARLFRLHDDIWFWGSDETCRTGWAAMEEFAELMGLKFSEEKTGSVCIPRHRREINTFPTQPMQTNVSGLPKGAVRWGFLRLETTGRFVIDQAMVDEHISELRTQQEACKSVFDWVQAWNIYAVRFFTTNFGRPANCNGRGHVDMILQTFQRIQKILFSSESGLVPTGGKTVVPIKSVSDYVRHMLTTKFAVTDIPEGYLYWPMARGGQKNPFVPFYAVRDQVVQDPDTIMDRFFELEEAAYKSAKRMYDIGTVQHRSGYNKYKSSLYNKETEFMSFEEYTRYRDQTSAELVDTYLKLMAEPADATVSLTPDVQAVLPAGVWDTMKTYDRWVMQLYASEMLGKFGGIQIVEKALLPIGLVGLTRKSRFMWKG